MLDMLNVKRFKAHQETALELGRITLLIGPQGVGKSSIVDALALLSEASGKEGISFTGPFSGLQFVDLVHQRKERDPIAIGLELSCQGAPAFLSENGAFRIAYEIAFDNRGFRDHHATYTFDGTAWEFRSTKMGRGEVPPDYVREGRPPVRFFRSTFTLHPFRFKVDGQDYPLHRGTDDLRLALAEFFGSLQFVPESRIVAQNACPLQGAHPEGTPHSLADLINKGAKEWEVRDELSEYLKELLERRLNFRVAGEEILIEIADGLGAPYPVMCEGAGLRGLLWPLGALACARPGSLIAIEEPEIHLHPKAIGMLSPLLARVATEKDVQLLLTTHNEHLLFSFLLSVAKGDLKPEDLRLYYMEGRQGKASIARLEIDEKGGVAGGLPGFFEATADEVDQFFSALQGGTKP